MFAVQAVQSLRDQLPAAVELGLPPGSEVRARVKATGVDVICSAPVTTRATPLSS
ncbi:MAG: hypothetical protein ABI873_01445 [Marmoricola sp.]